MCFGGGDGQDPPHNPAPYAVQDAWTAVDYEQTGPDGVTTKKPGTAPKTPPAPTGQASVAEVEPVPGLNTKGM